MNIHFNKRPLIEKLVACPTCHSGVTYENDLWYCTSCRQKIPITGGKLIYTKLMKSKSNENSRRVEFLKKVRKFLTVTSTYKTKESRSRIPKLVKELTAGQYAINVGSGNKDYGPEVLNIDIEAQDAVDVIADSRKLPLKSNSVALVISQAVLEHTPNTALNLQEISRVLQFGGKLYIEVPFMQTFHAHPHDYFRFTHAGLKSLLSDYVVVEEGIAVGPASAFALNMRVFLSTLFCFYNPFLFKVLMTAFSWITFPLKYFDIFLEKNDISYHSASGIYIIAKKQS